MEHIPEKDWKILRKFKDQLLERFCNETLNTLKLIIENRENENYKSYKKVWDILNHKDDELTLMFDDIRRSTAFNKLVSWRRSKLLSDKDFELFSKETRDTVNTLISIYYSK